MSREELLDLTRKLRRRVQQSSESEFLPRSSGLGASQTSLSAKSEISEAPRPTGDKAARFAALKAKVDACRACPLGNYRLNAVFGVGSVDARVMFVGEGPGFEEDHRGEPFVGRSGQLLDKIIESIGLSRKTVYIANIVKCHPMKDPSDPEARSNDRPPTPEEIAGCRAYLDEQIEVIEPEVIVTLGNVPARVLLDTKEGISKIRGQWRSYRPKGSSRAIKLLPTYHPAALLRDPNLKKDVWTDMKNLKKELEG